ncbi:hypothetical protein V5799_018634 [Amblyomma americanum]|uniref:Uncharacterized protein n=1 Tax=Amblyomma americanum TaxID=6943 RepID=A0AAQ4EZI4_AMBAM
MLMKHNFGGWYFHYGEGLIVRLQEVGKSLWKFHTRLHDCDKRKQQKEEEKASNRSCTHVFSVPICQQQNCAFQK